MFLDVSLPLWTTAQTLTWMFGHELKITQTYKVRKVWKCVCVCGPKRSLHISFALQFVHLVEVTLMTLEGMPH